MRGIMDRLVDLRCTMVLALCKVNIAVFFLRRSPIDEGAG